MPGFPSRGCTDEHQEDGRDDEHGLGLLDDGGEHEAHADHAEAVGCDDIGVR
jgi:hypothetical protein